MLIYVDGVLSDTDTGDAGNIDNEGDLHFGESPGNTNGLLDGKIDDVRVYNRALSATDVLALYENWQPGRIRYNTNWRAAEYFDGNRWVGMGRKHYVPNAVSFDGTNDSLSQSSSYSADGKSATGSFWFRRTGTGRDTIYRFNSTGTYNATNLRFLIEFNAADRLHIQGRSSVPANVLDGISTTAITDTNWHHAMVSFDLTQSDGDCDPAILIYLDGVKETLSGTPVCSDTAIDFDVTTDRTRIGSGSDSSSTGNMLNADIADFWIDFGRYVDFGQAANRAKFYSSGDPVYLGSTGTLPFAAAPEIFLSGDAAAWHTNDGTGGGFTENGALDGTLGPGGIPALLMRGSASGTGGQDIAVSGGFAYVTNDADTLSVLDVSDPDSPSIRDTLSDAWFTGNHHLDVQGNYAYVVGNGVDRLTIVDISDPDDISITGSVQDAANLDGAFFVAVRGDYAYVTAENADRLTVVDVSNTSAPSVVGSVQDATNLNGPQGLALSGNYAYVGLGNDDQITVVDISNPVSPSVVTNISDGGWLPCTYCYPVVDGNFIYYPAGGVSALTIVDISNPTSPVLRGGVIDSRLFEISDVAIIGDKAYVTSFSPARVTEIDVSNPAAPFVVDSLYHLTNLNGANYIDTQGDLVYTTAYWANRVSVIDTRGPQCANPARSAGKIIYNTTQNYMQFCNGEDWIAMGPPGAGGAGCSNPSRGEGQMLFNSAEGYMQYCDGADWVRVGGQGIAPPTTNGLVGYWKLDETSGTTAYASAGGIDGTMLGGMDAGTDSVAGQIGTSLDFDGTDDHIDLGNPASLQLTTAFTLAAWVNADVIVDDDIISKTDWPSSKGYLINVNDVDTGANRVACLISANGSGYNVYYSDAVLLEDTWYHVGCIYDGAAGTLDIYVNGQLSNMAGNGAVNSIYNSTSNVVIGRRELTAGNEWDGYIDDARIYNRALSAAEIYNLYRATGGN